MYFQTNLKGKKNYLSDLSVVAFSRHFATCLFVLLPFSYGPFDISVDIPTYLNEVIRKIILGDSNLTENHREWENGSYK